MIFKFGKKGGSGGRGQDEEEVELIRFQGASNGVPLDVEANQKLVRIAFDPVKELFTDAVTRGAETIRIDPKGERATIGFLIDGVPVPAGRIPRQRAHAMTQMTKLLAGLNSAERSQPQAGGIKASLEDSEFELTVLTQPIAGGVERLLVHVRDLDETLDRPEDCAMTDDLKTKIREVTGLRQGLFIACGGSRTGVTTTLYACIRGIDAYLRDIQTIGDTQDRELINIATFETNPEDDLQETLRRCFRVEPDVILLDPIDDADDAREHGLGDPAWLRHAGAEQGRRFIPAESDRQVIPDLLGPLLQELNLQIDLKQCFRQIRIFNDPKSHSFKGRSGVKGGDT